MKNGNTILAGKCKVFAYLKWETGYASGDESIVNGWEVNDTKTYFSVRTLNLFKIGTKKPVEIEFMCKKEIGGFARLYSNEMRETFSHFSVSFRCKPILLRFCVL